MYYYIVGVLGMWLLADGWYSLACYLGKEGQTFWKDHVIRWIRIAIGIALIVIGALNVT